MTNHDDRRDRVSQPADDLASTTTAELERQVDLELQNLAAAQRRALDGARQVRQSMRSRSGLAGLPELEGMLDRWELSDRERTEQVRAQLRRLGFAMPQPGGRSPGPGPVR